MTTKAGYIDGERVYVFDSWLHPVPLAVNEKHNYDDCQIFKHRDIVKMLNKFLKKIEVADNQDFAKNGLDGLGGYSMCLYSLISGFDSYDKSNFTPYKVMAKDAIVFDDEKNIKKTKLPRLNLPRCNASPKDFRGLKVIDGGRVTIGRATITY